MAIEVADSAPGYGEVEAERAADHRQRVADAQRARVAERQWRRAQADAADDREVERRVARLDRPRLLAPVGEAHGDPRLARTDDVRVREHEILRHEEAGAGLLSALERHGRRQASRRHLGRGEKARALGPAADRRLRPSHDERGTGPEGDHRDAGDDPGERVAAVVAPEGRLPDGRAGAPDEGGCSPSRTRMAARSATSRATPAATIPLPAARRACSAASGGTPSPRVARPRATR